MIPHSKESHHYLHAFCTHPDVQFDSQKPNEEVVLVLRKHPITQIPWVLNTIVLFILLISLNFFIAQFLYQNQMIVFNLFALVFIFAYVWLNLLIWLFNVGIVTNIRVLDVDLYNVLYKEVTATKVEQVTDVTSKIGGYLGSLFQFGHVEVKTEGFTQNIEFASVPRPTDVVHIINELIPSGNGKRT